MESDTPQEIVFNPKGLTFILYEVQNNLSTFTPR